MSGSSCEDISCELTLVNGDFSGVAGLEGLFSPGFKPCPLQDYFQDALTAAAYPGCRPGQTRSGERPASGGSGEE